MRTNPEFARNLWLEFSPHRLIAMPLVLGTIFLLAYLADKEGPEFMGDASGTVAYVMFILVVLLWGSRMAADAVVQEINGRTWDGQRMSAIGPWSMTWGKLFGSTAFAWYGGLICMAFYAVIKLHNHLAPSVLKDLVILAEAGILAHAVGLLMSLATVQKGWSPGRGQIALLQFIGFIVAVIPITHLLGGVVAVDHVTWFDTRFGRIDFFLMVLTAYVAWAVAGVYFLMRAELRMANSPLVWPGFVVFSMAFAAGFGRQIFADDPFLPDRLPDSRAALAFLISLILLYLIAFGEPKHRVLVRQLGEHFRLREWAKAATLTPRSILTMPLVLVAGIWLMASESGDPFLTIGRVKFDHVAVATMLFAARDVGFIYYMNLARMRRRADLSAFIYLMLLYSIVPAILWALSLRPLATFFWPLPEQGFLLTVGPVFLEVVAVYALLVLRLRGILTEKV